MRTILLTLAFLLSFPVFAQTASRIPSFECNGRVYTDMTNFKMLYAAVQTINRFSAFIDSSGEYQVPAGKTFRVVCIKTLRWSGTGSSLASFGFSATGPLGLNQAAAPTSPTWLGGSVKDCSSDVSNACYIGGPASPGATIDTESYAWPVDNWVITASNYPFVTIRAVADQLYAVYGYEE